MVQSKLSCLSLKRFRLSSYHMYFSASLLFLRTPLPSMAKTFGSRRFEHQPYFKRYTSVKCTRYIYYFTCRFHRSRACFWRTPFVLPLTLIAGVMLTGWIIWKTWSELPKLDLHINKLSTLYNIAQDLKQYVCIFILAKEITNEDSSIKISSTRINLVHLKFTVFDLPA